MKTILQLNAGVNYPQSTTRMLASEIVGAIKASDSRIVERDLTLDVPSVYNAATLGATRGSGTSAAEQVALAEGDLLIDELLNADVIVIAAPMYNFSIPASLKLWIDHVARAGRTFSYSADGPKGLLKNKKAYIVISSGGVPLESPMDFATPYLKTVLGFIGITDVTVIGATQMNANAEAAVEVARQQISALVG